MSAALEIVQGDEKNIIVAVTGASVATASNIKFVLQQGKVAPEAEFQLSMSAGEITIDSAVQFTITLTAALTADLTPGKYEIQAQLTDGGGLLKGIVFDPSYVVILQRLKIT
jgi:hypothetical protein